jgi:hypothetical protein
MLALKYGRIGPKLRNASGPRAFAVKKNFKFELFLDRTVQKQCKSGRLELLLLEEEEEECHGQNCGLKWMTPRPSNKIVPPQLALKSDSRINSRDWE